MKRKVHGGNEKNRARKKYFFLKYTHISIETGQYKGEALDNIICTLCYLKCVEDECHFLLQCTAYSNLKTELYTSVSCKPTLSLSSFRISLDKLPNLSIQRIFTVIDVYKCVLFLIISLSL